MDAKTGYSLVSQYLIHKGFRINKSASSQIDFWAELDDRNRGTRHVTGVSISHRPSPISESYVRKASTLLKSHLGVNEILIVGTSFSKAARVAAKEIGSISLTKWSDLDVNEEVTARTTEHAPEAKTTFGKAVLANYEQLLISASSLLILIDEKIGALRAERPNSPEAKADRDAELKEYKAIKRSLTGLSSTAVTFQEGKTKESNLVVSVNTFSE